MTWRFLFNIFILFHFSYLLPPFYLMTWRFLFKIFIPIHLFYLLPPFYLMTWRFLFKIFIPFHFSYLWPPFYLMTWRFLFKIFSPFHTCDDDLTIHSIHSGSFDFRIFAPIGPKNQSQSRIHNDRPGLIKTVFNQSLSIPWLHFIVQRNNRNCVEPKCIKLDPGSKKEPSWSQAWIPTGILMEPKASLYCPKKWQKLCRA